MRLRSALTLAFVALAALQVIVVVPLALRNLSQLLEGQQDAHVAQSMAAVETEMARFRHDVGRSMDELALSQALEDGARDAAKSPPPPQLAAAAAQLMAPRGLDVLALLDEEGRTMSSGHLPARVGEPSDPLFAITREPSNSVVAALVQLSGPNGLTEAPAMVTARSVDYGDRRFWAVGGVLLTQAHARNWAQLTGARVEIISNGATLSSAGEVREPSMLRVVSLGEVARVQFSFSRAFVLATQNQVLTGFLALALLGLLLSVALGFLVSRRITRPVEALTDAAQRIALGEPGVTVDMTGGTGELKALVNAFNRMTDDLKQATDKLVASERIAAWQEVARRLAHEIKNPLTPIRMSLETLLAASQRGPFDERFRTLLRDGSTAILEEVDRLKRIVNEFSHFARLPRPNLSPFDLSQTLSSIMGLYSPHDGLSYEVSIEPGVCVLGDRDLLTQVLVNLVKNAEEAMATDGGCIRVSLTQSATEATVQVEDEGPGIPPELEGRIFEPYVTSKPQGSGLGLAIAQRIAQEHGGQLVASTASAGLAKGARFRLVLPRAAPPVSTS